MIDYYWESMFIVLAHVRRYCFRGSVQPVMAGVQMRHPE